MTLDSMAQFPSPCSQTLEPPPPYTEREFRIRRKPVGDNRSEYDYETARPTTAVQTASSQNRIHQAEFPGGLVRRNSFDGLSTGPSQRTASNEIRAIHPAWTSPSIGTTSSQSSVGSEILGSQGGVSPGASKKSSFAQKALEETTYFVGGLIERPTEGNKHYTILRHSHGIVFYRGPNTYVVISIFSDAPLPHDRTLWLQTRGFTGKTGMKAKAFFGFNDDWINVTPNMTIGTAQVKARDERAWQRDIAKFKKKAPRQVRERQQLRETVIIRVPVEAEDGYYHVVLCTGEKKKVLCTSPVFRILSTSSDPSVIRGASLSTLPLELGAWVTSLYTTGALETFISPVTDRLESVLDPLSHAQLAAEAAAAVSGTDDRLDNAQERLEQDKTAPYQGTPAGQLDVEAGPVPPYPIKFVAKTNLDQSMYSRQSCPTKRDLVGVPPKILQRLRGVYLGWARRIGGQAQKVTPTPTDRDSLQGDWQQVIVSAAPAYLANREKISDIRTEKAFRTHASISFLDEELWLPPQVEVEVRIMGYIRPPEPPPGQDHADPAAIEERRLLFDVYDRSLARDILDHSAWGPDAVPRVPCTKSNSRENPTLLERTMTGLAQACLKSEQALSKVPLHRIGMRTCSDEWKERNVDVRGFCIPR